MNWKWIFEKGMFWVLILIFCVGNYFSGLEVELSDVAQNKGWVVCQSIQCVLNKLVVFGSWLLFFMVYGVVTLMKKKTNLMFSIIHAAMFVFTMIIVVCIHSFSNLAAFISLISIIVLGLNLYKTFKIQT